MQMMVEALLGRVLIRNNQYIPSNGGWVIFQFDQYVRGLPRFDNVGSVCDILPTRGLPDVLTQGQSL